MPCLAIHNWILSFLTRSPSQGTARHLSALKAELGLFQEDRPSTTFADVAAWTNQI